MEGYAFYLYLGKVLFQPNAQLENFRLTLKTAGH